MYLKLLLSLSFLWFAIPAHCQVDGHSDVDGSLLTIGQADNQADVLIKGMLTNTSVQDAMIEAFGLFDSSLKGSPEGLKDDVVTFLEKIPLAYHATLDGLNEYDKSKCKTCILLYSVIMGWLHPTGLVEAIISEEEFQDGPLQTLYRSFYATVAPDWREGCHITPEVLINRIILSCVQARGTLISFNTSLANNVVLDTVQGWNKTRIDQFTDWFVSGFRHAISDIIPRAIVNGHLSNVMDMIGKLLKDAGTDNEVEDTLGGIKTAICDACRVKVLNNVQDLEPLFQSLFDCFEGPEKPTSLEHLFDGDRPRSANFYLKALTWYNSHTDQMALRMMRRSAEIPLLQIFCGPSYDIQDQAYITQLMDIIGVDSEKRFHLRPLHMEDYDLNNYKRLFITSIGCYEAL